MKKLYVYFIGIMLIHFTCKAKETTTYLDHAPANKEAVEIITGIADGLADLIIAHKKTLSVEEKKQRSIVIIQKITEAITLIIARAKIKKHSKSVLYYDEHTLHQTIEHLALHLLQAVESAQQNVELVQQDIECIQKETSA